MVNGGKRAEINAGQSVTFTAEVEVPENMGKIVAAAWNFEGLSKEVEKQPGWNFTNSDAFPVAGKIAPAGKSGSRNAHPGPRGSRGRRRTRTSPMNSSSR